MNCKRYLLRNSGSGRSSSSVALCKRDGECLYHFEPFLAGITTLRLQTQGSESAHTLDVAEVDTVVVPAQPEGFQATFLGENRWHAIRIHGTMRPQIKYIAAYQVRPISAITHVASVSSIEPWG